MTKTFTAVLVYCVPNPALREITRLDALLKADNLLVCKEPCDGGLTADDLRVEQLSCFEF